MKKKRLGWDDTKETSLITEDWGNKFTTIFGKKNEAVDYYIICVKIWASRREGEILKQCEPSGLFHSQILRREK